MQFRDVCFGGAPPINRADELTAFFPTMSLHLAGGLNLTLSPLNYLFLHASEVRALTVLAGHACRILLDVYSSMLGTMPHSSCVHRNTL